MTSAKDNRGAKRRGRPPGARNTSTIVREVARERMPISEGSEERMVTLAEALLIKLRQLAMAGDIAADKALNKLVARLSPDAPADAGVLLAPAALSTTEWIRRTEISNRYKERPPELAEMFPPPADRGPAYPPGGSAKKPPVPFQPYGPSPNRNRLIR